MKYTERLLKVIYTPHISEKVSKEIEKNNTVVFKVIKDATKTEIKAAIQKLFDVQIKSVNTLLVKGKTKRHGQRIYHRSNWKKAYITLKKGEKLDNIIS